MKSFEPVYKELEELFIHKLPDYIEKINKEHNDGIIITKFENKLFKEKGIKKPSFTFELKQTEYSEKDRIIETNTYLIKIFINITESSLIIFSRYVEAIDLMVREQETKFKYKITNIYDTIIDITISNEYY